MAAGGKREAAICVALAGLTLLPFLPRVPAASQPSPWALLPRAFSALSELPGLTSMPAWILHQSIAIGGCASLAPGSLLRSLPAEISR